MAVYLPKYDGYIVDNPDIDFIRCDGTAFSFKEVSTASVTNTSNQITVTGGQGRSPLAYIDSDITSELTFSSALFTLDMFAMANAEPIEEGDYGTLESGVFTLTKSGGFASASLPFEVKEGSVKVLRPAGFVEVVDPEYGMPDIGEFEVHITEAGEDTEGATQIQFGPVNQFTGIDEIRVAYIRRVVEASKVSVTTESTTAKGSLYAHYPVYSSGSDCSEESKKGILHICMERCRATALPGFDNSYKTSSTNSVTFSAIDTKKKNKNFVEYFYEDLTEEGEPVEYFLSDLWIDAYGSVGKIGSLTPTFSADETEYTVSVDLNSNVSLAFIVTAEADDGVPIFMEKDGAYTKPNFSVDVSTMGIGSQKTVELTVTAGDGFGATTYTVTITILRVS